MRIHSDNLIYTVLRDAARVARVDMTLTEHGSRSRDRAFNVTLRGESKRRANGGKNGAANDYAATWDQWGVFLAILFNFDPGMTCWAYSEKAVFDFRTAHRFDPGEIEGDWPGALQAFWPADYHGDHTFRWVGVPYEQSCTKCGAMQRWEPRAA